jgi:hypothetical protein
MSHKLFREFSRTVKLRRKAILQISVWTMMVIAAVSWAGASPRGAQEQKPADDKTAAPRPAAKPGAKGGVKPGEELPDGAMKQKATATCTECHDSGIILQQRLSKAAWTKTVDKMIKWGADVDPDDHDALIEYLSTNFNPDKPPYEAPKTAAEKSAATKGSK